MAEINWAGVNKKVDAWSKTPEGKRRMQEILRQKMESGNGKTGCGDVVATKAEMKRMADELIRIIQREAASCDLPDTVMAHFDSLTYIVQEHKDGTWEFDFYFADDLHRESVIPASGRGGRGIGNIIALFNNGYVASRPKYGWWKDHPPFGEKNLRGVGHENDAFIKTTQARPSLHFMQKAIAEFEAKYAKKYNLSVTLNGEVYDGNYGGSLNGVIRAFEDD